MIKIQTIGFLVTYYFYMAYCRKEFNRIRIFDIIMGGILSFCIWPVVLLVLFVLYANGNNK